ncbi:hypothetical protein [Enterocloster lavalensis]|uniref:hypothetical protein n=1 Tax=Enterocloster lavalensis TaxID=460384 RepID=UPI002A7F508F|nr:hypothetical protein [Enterocloster lavalensis]
MLRIRIGYDERSASWLTFPQQPGKIDLLYTEMQKDPPMIVYEAESSIPALPEVLKGMRTDAESARALACLAKRLEYLTQAEQELFSAVLKAETQKSGKDILNLSYNLDNYELVAGNHDPGQTGQTVRKVEGKTFQDVYHGEFPPDAGYDKNSVFLLHIYTGRKGYSLAVPTTPEKMEMARVALDLKSLNQCKFNQYGGPFQELWGYLPTKSDLKEVNRIATILKEKVLSNHSYTLNFLKAVFLAECPRTMKEALSVVRNMGNYEFLDQVQEPGTYAREVIRSYGDPSLEPLLDRYVDWDAIGQAMMKEHGAVQTRYGIVTSKKWCCERLSDETVVTRLYNQLTGVFCGSEGYDESFSATELTIFEKQIREELEQDSIFEQKTGLAEYMDNQLMKQRILSMFPAIEVYHHALWGVLQIEIKGELTPDELEWTKKYWMGQASDGWGESFEQTDIECEDGGILNVYFYNSSMIYGPRTEQELKGVESVQQGPQMGGMW